MTRIRSRIDAALAALEQEGRLAPDLRELVAERIRLALNAGRGRDFTTVVAMLGGLLVAAGLLYLIGYNWDALGRPVKLGLIFVVWGALHAAGWYLAERPGRYPGIGRAFTLAGVLAFGGAVGLVAQIYHLSAHYPNSILAWWVLSVPLVLVTRSRAVLAAVIAIALLWVGWHLQVWIHDHGTHRERDWLANYLLVAGASGTALLALAKLAESSAYDELAGTLRAPVLLLVAAAPFGLAFHWPWWRDRESWWGEEAHLTAGLAPAAVAAVVAAVLSGVATWRRGGAAARDCWILLALVVLPGVLALLAPKWVPVLANLVLFGGSLGLVALGVAEARSRLATFGIFLFVAGVVARYFEYLWDKLEGAYAFLASGALLLAAAFLFENRRRAVAARLRKGGP